MANLYQPSTITAAQKQQADSIFSQSGRVAYYSYMYSITGNQAFLDMAQISSNSGKIFGGPAWVFNEILKHTPGLDYNLSVTQFSELISKDINSSPVLNPNGTYTVLSQIEIYDRASAVWSQQRLGAVAPPDLMKALVLIGAGDFTGAWNALGQNSSNPVVGALSKGAPTFLGWLLENTNITNSGNNFYDLLLANPTATVQQFGDSFAVVKGNEYLGVFTNQSIRVGEAVRLTGEMNVNSPNFKAELIQSQVARAAEIASLGSRVPSFVDKPSTTSSNTWVVPNSTGTNTSYTLDLNNKSVTTKEQSLDGQIINAQRAQFMEGKTISTRLNANLEPIETASVYKVQSGDTLSSIAQKNNTTVSALQAANPQISNPNKILAGEDIYIPLAVHNVGNTWTVGSGANGELIAAASGITLAQLEAENPGVDVRNPPLGTVLKLPSVRNVIAVTTTTTAPNISQNGVVSEAAAAAAINNGFAINSAINTVSFSNGELNSVSTYATTIAAMTTNGIRPGNFNVLPDGSVAPIPALLISNTTPTTTITVPSTTVGSNYTVNSYGVIIPNILNSRRTYVDPLILDLNNDGVQLTSYAERTVLFDIDHDGLVAGKPTLEQTGWIKTNTTTNQAINMDGIVVHDLNNNGVIDGIHETLSEFYNGAIGVDSNTAGKKEYKNGFEALESLDTGSGIAGSAGYKDNIFDNKDVSFSELRVWVDANANGITDTGELKTFTELGVTSISLNTTNQSGLVNGGNEVLASGTFTQNGENKQAQSVNFLANTAGSSFTEMTGGVRIDTQAGQTGQVTSTYTHTGTNNANLNTATLNVKNIYGSTGNETITGDASSNWLGGGAGADTIRAGAGDDVLLIDAADTIVDGGEGNDIAQVIGDAGVTLNLSNSNIEAVVGGRGDDVFIGGGRGSIFVTGNDGNDIVIGGAANDVLAGEDGDDYIDGGAGNDLLRGGRGNDRVLGGSGDDLVEGGQGDDNLSGGEGNDVLNGGQGDDTIDGGAGSDIVKYSGSYADYRVTKLNATTYRVSDLKGRDGTDTLSNIEKLSFSDLEWISPDSPAPLPVRDILDKNSFGAQFTRSGIQYINKAQLLGNDMDRQNDVLHISVITDVQGGQIVGNYNSDTKEYIPTYTANGDIQFIPDANYTGIMGFKYSIADALNNQSTITDASSNQSATMKASVYLRTPDIPNDPLVVDQWYLSEAKIIPVWKDYSGKGVKIAQFEVGSSFAVGPEVLDMTHPDIKPNLDASWLGNPDSNISQSYSSHATLVAGVMVGARNGEGGVGVAYNAKISGHYMENSPVGVDNALMQFKNYDVVNNSWSTIGNFKLTVEPVGALQQGINDALKYGRGGLGTAIVMAGGNDRQIGVNTNASPLTNNRGVIVAGGVNAKSDLGSLQIGGLPFSNPGASILVSAPASNILSSSRLIEASNGSTFGSDYSATQGTSFATPIISGVVALILEANPNLGWRDVQQILAITAKQVDDPNTDLVWNGANNWNGGGMHTSHDYGFGMVDARAAVRLAETWVSAGGIHTSDNERHLMNGEGSVNGASNLNIAIADGASITRTVSIGAGLRVEHATVSLDVNHSNWGDLTVELISPTGTVSKLVTNPGTTTGNAGGDVGTGRLTFAFDTTHDLGENAQGNWQLRITDRSGHGAGTLYGWRVDVYGSDFNEKFNRVDTPYSEAPVISAIADNVYYFTDEFASAPGTNRNSITDINGGLDIINASAVSNAMIIDLNEGGASTIAGRSLTLSGGIEYAVGGDGNDVLFGNNLNNTLMGGRGDDKLYGGDGADFLDGGLGRDGLYGGNGNDILLFDDDMGQVDTGTQTLNYGMMGGAGADTFIINKNAVRPNSPMQLSSGNVNGTWIINLVNLIGDFETIRDVIDLRNYPSVKSMADLTFTQPLTGFGINLTRIQLGNAGTAPYIHLYNVSPGSLSASNFVFDSSTTIPTPTPPTPSILVGNSGGNVLNGTTGADQLEGRTGDDTYIVDNSNDFIIELPGGGYDAVQSSVSYELLENVELLTLTGTSNIDGTGNNAANRIVGNSGNNKLDGKGGSDDMVGGLGNDTYVVDVGTDRITENANEGTDTVQSSVSWTLGKNLENLTLTGTADINATGNELSNVLLGNSGNNILDGAQGADAMRGGAGDDIYYIDNVSDVITENTNEGNDTVYISVNRSSLFANVENVILYGTTATTAFGNALNNRLIGNELNNTLTDTLGGDDYLDGGLGGDSMAGGLGDDIYIVDSFGDSVIENANAGTDTVMSSINFSLANLPNVENITLIGANNITATGNANSNVLIGNSGNNTLNGGAGIDTLIGGSGDDTYIVDTDTDIITELDGGGVDTVMSNISLTLGVNLENLTLTGANAINGAGNDSSNVLTGNSGNNILSGGFGSDTLIGGAGNDTYVVAQFETETIDGYTPSMDVIVETDTTAGNIDTVEVGFENLLQGQEYSHAYGNYTFYLNVNRKLTNDNHDNLEISAEGSYITDSPVSSSEYFSRLLIQDQFKESSKIEQIKFSPTGEVLAMQSYLTRVGYNFIGSDNNDTMYGTSGVKSMSGGLGNDFMYGNEASNTLYGGAGDDTLSGGAGDDYLYGGDGSDTYVFSRGDGIDVAADEHWNPDYIAISGGSFESQTIRVNASSNEVNLTRTANLFAWGSQPAQKSNLVVEFINNTADRLTFNDWWSVDSSNANRKIVFNDKTINLDEIEMTLTFKPSTTGADLRYGSNRNDTISGSSGNDILIGMGGADILNGDNGQDRLYGGLGNDQLYGGLDNDYLYGEDGNDSLYGGDGNDTLDGGVGADRLDGGTGWNTYYVDNIGDVVVGNGEVYSDIQTYTLANGQTNWVTISNNGSNALGNAEDNTIKGNSRSNFIIGNAGIDHLSGGVAGFDILQGGEGNDSLDRDVNGWYTNDALGNAILDGGAGDDYLSSRFIGQTGQQAGNDALIGGKGNDIIYASRDQDGIPGEDSEQPYYAGMTGNDVILFNVGDGQDTLYAGDGPKLTLSLGRLTSYDQLSLTKSGSDLVLNVGVSDKITLADWYANNSAVNTKSIANLQVVAESIQGFSKDSTNKLHDNIIETFNFANVVAAFDAAGAQANWQLTESRLATHLKSGSNTEAIGGDIAYQYGHYGNLTGMGLNSTQAVLSDANFGKVAQTFSTSTIGANEAIRLS